MVKHNIFNIDDDCFWLQKILIILFGFSTNKGILYNAYSMTLLTLITIYPFLEIIEIPNKLDDLNELIYSMLFKIGYTTCLSIIYSISFNRVRLNRIFTKCKNLKVMSNMLMEHKNPILKQNEDFIKKQSYYGTALTVISLANLISLSMIMSRNRKTWIYPFGWPPNFYNGNLELLLQSIFYFTIGFMFLSIVVIHLNLLALISCHCQVLQVCIKKILENSHKNLLQSGKFTLASKNNVPWSFIKPELGRIVDYHVGIIEIAAEIEKGFHIVTLALFTGMSADLCIAIYHMLSLPLKNENILKDIVLLFITYFSMTIPSYRGQQVLTESEKIVEACCQIDFAGTDIRFQKALMMIIRNSQKPIIQTIGKTKILCLSTMVGVFQTTYSFYTFLRNVKNA